MGSEPLRGFSRHWTYSDKPADKWEFANVCGNGELGAIHFGQPHKETIIVNHAELFLPTGSPQTMPDMSFYLEDVRRISKSDGYRASHQFFIEKGEELGHTIVDTDPFHPGFFLNIEQSQTEGLREYCRYTDFEKGEIGSSWENDGNRFQRRLFSSRTDQLIALSIKMDEHLPLTCLTIDENNHPLIKSRYECLPNDVLVGTHDYVHGKGGYYTFVHIKNCDGTIQCTPTSIEARNASKLLILMKIIPFAEHNEDMVREVSSLFCGFSDTYEALFDSHQVKHSEVFNRVSLNLNGGEKRGWSTDQLLADVKETSSVPPALLERLFDAGRYMFICSAGVRPPNLQGIWTGTWEPSWSSDYTLDTNLQLAMASVFSCNMLEGIHPYTALLDSYMEDFRYNARMLFGCRGILSGVRASSHGRHLHWGESSWGDRECDTFFGAFWTCGGGWLAHWLYDYYLYTGNQQFLREHALPFMLEIIAFYEDFLYEEEGIYVFNPSYSAENGIAFNSTQDIAVAKEVLNHTIEACRELGIYQESIHHWQQMIEKMPPYLINEDGALKEWAVWDHDDNYNHRHFSHLYPLFQSYEFSDTETPELWEASKRALELKMEHWLYNPDTDTSSHGRMHAGLSAARLGMGDVVIDIIRMMAAGGAIYPSLMTAHYDHFNVFNVDANGCIPELLVNLLVFSLPGKLELLPAIPKNLTKGAVEGILCRKRMKISTMEWDLEEGILSCTLLSDINQEISLSIEEEKGNWFLNNNQRDTWKINLKAGENTTLTFKQKE
ncbi:hypothetical protein F7984_15060 [Pradoshia sp. D12]|uniref:glycosyl hydrolase family 95 catalytic domain-containing protein n=1 Tax=Bacillaceae TaxID=186817 RepID=UPI0011279988|nr:MULTISPECIES: glycoside hydrolase N-terminal domain-containing protein [Bacillaceae]QFK72468.1 hypothetical protein F7984_15060 [Pradoshia sp. D12]TPF70788.1 hypothetical protein FHY44_16160 [Bacillus sp. D12]